MKRLSRWFFAALGLFLAIAVGAQFVPKKDEPFFVPPKPLSSIVPTVAEGWVVQERELGETEMVREEVKKILRYDDAFFRTYTRGNTTVGVYVAYWGPGVIHPIDAATHSPDLCWVNAGWKELKHDYECRLQDGGNQGLKIAQFREFTAGVGGRQEVVFWHLIGGQLSGYALGPSSRWRERLPVLWAAQSDSRFGFRKREQYFIRISTNGSMGELVKDPLWREIINGLGRTGLYQKEP